MLTMFSPNLSLCQRGTVLVSFCIVSFAFFGDPALFPCCHFRLLSFLLLQYLYGYSGGLRLTKALWHPVILTAYEQYFSFSRSDGHKVTAITSLLFCVIIAERWSYVHAVVSLELTGGQGKKEERKTQTEKLIKNIHILMVLLYFFIFYEAHGTHSGRKSKRLICMKGYVVHQHT